MEGTTIQQRIRYVQPKMLNSLTNQLRGGISVNKIADEWNVSNNVVYYWIYKLKLPIKEIKYKLISKNRKLIQPKIKKYSYFYYIQQSHKRGEMDNKEKQKSLNIYYHNRKNIFFDYKVEI